MTFDSFSGTSSVRVGSRCSLGCDGAALGGGAGGGWPMGVGCGSTPSPRGIMDGRTAFKICKNDGGCAGGPAKNVSRCERRISKK